MTEWNEFILSEEFTAYRKRQVEVISKHVHGILVKLSPGDAERLTGAMDLAFKILRLPRELTGDKKIEAQIAGMIEQDMADVSAYLIHKRFLDSNEQNG